MIALTVLWLNIDLLIIDVQYIKSGNIEFKIVLPTVLLYRNILAFMKMHKYVICINSWETKP